VDHEQAAQEWGLALAESARLRAHRLRYARRKAAEGVNDVAYLWARLVDAHERDAEQIDNAKRAIVESRVLLASLQDTEPPKRQRVHGSKGS
jgi:hypothetical protein